MFSPPLLLPTFPHVPPPPRPPPALPAPLLAADSNWPMWRGPQRDGSSTEQNIPTKWNDKTGENIAWKVELPGTGHSSPIAWGDRVFVVSCLEDTKERVLLSLDRKTGKTIWQQDVLEVGLEKKHGLNSFASGTPATDGKLVYVTFLAMDGTVEGGRTPGDMVVAAYDFDGNQKWPEQDPQLRHPDHSRCRRPHAADALGEQ